MKDSFSTSGKLLLAVTTLTLLTGFAIATSVSQDDTNAPATEAAVGETIPVYQFQIQDGGDALLAGTAPSPGTALTSTNPWSGNTDPVAFVDTTTTGTWDSGSDLILQDYNNGGTVSTSADTVVNDGGTSNRAGGDTLTDLSTMSGGQYVDLGTAGYNAGDEIFSDDDNDGFYTAQADQVIDTDGSTGTADYGSTADMANAAVLTGAETVSVAAGTSVGGSGALYYVDSDSSGGYSSTDEIVLEPNPGSTGALTLDAGQGTTGTDEDGDGSTDDDIILSSGSDGTIGATEGDTLVQFSAGDNIAFEDDAGTGASSNDGAYNDGEDIVVDYHDGGTYSAASDTALNTGNDGTIDSSDGATLNALSGIASSTYYAVSGDSTLNAGEDIVQDDDGDGLYTAQADNRLAGDTLSNIGAGTSVTTTNPSWDVAFYDSNTAAWESGSDAIIDDVDTNGVYQDQLTETTATNSGSAGTGDVNLQLWSGTDCSSGSQIGSDFEFGSSLSGLAQDITSNTDYTVCAYVESGATDGADITTDVSSLTLASGDKSGSLSANSNTQTLDTAAPSVSTTEVTANDQVTVTFSEGVYANNDATGNLQTSDFSYSDNSGDGASSISSVSHTAGDSAVVITLNTDVKNSDVGSDTVDVSSSSVYDNVGNVASSSSNTVQDTNGDDVNPTVSSFTATEGGDSSTKAVDISFDSDETLSSIQVIIDSTTLTETEFTETDNGDGTFTYDYIYNPGSDGSYTATLDSVTDGGSNTINPGTSSFATVDTTGPSFGTVTSPSSPTTQTQPTVSVDSVTDALNTVDSSTIQVDLVDSSGTTDVTYTGTSVTGLSYTSNTVSLDLSSSGTGDTLTDDTYDVFISAADDDEVANSNSNTFASAFTVDTTPPTVQNVQISEGDGDGQVTNGDSVTIQADVSDANSISSVETDASAFNAGTVTLTDSGSGTYDATFTVGSSPTEGDQSLTVDATDGAGNTGSESSGTLTVDTTSPTVDSIDTSTPIYTQSSQDNDVQFTYTEQYPVQATVTISNSQTYSVTTGGTSVQTTQTFSSGNLPAEGTYDLTVQLSDEVDQTGSTTVTDGVVVDDTAPTVSSVTLSDNTDSNGVVKDGDQVLVTADVADTLSGVGSVTVDGSNFGAAGSVTMVDDGSGADSTPNDGIYTGTFTVSGSGSTDGTTSATVTGTDKAGNSNTGSDSLTIDTTAPTYDSAITGDSTTGESTAKNNVVLEFTEATSGIDSGTVDASDFVVEGNTVTGIASTTSNTVTLTLGTALGTGEKPYVNLTSSGSISDVAGNTLSGKVSNTANDGLRPEVSGIVTKDTGKTAGDVDTATVNFTEAINDGTVNAGDWTIAGITVDSFNTGDSVDDNRIKLVLSDANEIDSTDVQEVAYTPGSLADSGGNTLVDADYSETDGAEPVVETATITKAPISESNAGNSQTVDVTFSEPMNTGVSPTVEITGVANGPLTVSQDSYSTNTWSGSVTINDNNEDVTATIDISGAEDSSGLTQQQDTSNTFLVDTLAPEVAWTTLESGDYLRGTVDLTSKSDINYSDGGDTTYEYNDGSWTEITTESSWDSTAASDGSVDFRITDTDDVSNTATDTVTATVDNTAPTFDSAITGDSTTGDSTAKTKMTLSFTETTSGLNASTFEASDFDVTGYSVDGVSVSGQAAALTLGSELGTGETPDVTLSGTVADNAGNTVTGTTVSSTSDGLKPELVHAEIDHSLSTSASTYVKATFSEPVDTGGTPGATLDLGTISASSEQDGDTTDSTYVFQMQDVLDTARHPNITAVSGIDDNTGGSGNAAVLEDGQKVEVDTFRRQIAQGWNYVSFPTANGVSTPIDEVIDTSKVDTVWRYDSVNSEWESYDPDASSNDFNAFEGGVGYQIDASSSFTFAPNVNNTDASATGGSTPTPTTQLGNGWNLVGQWQEFSQTANNNNVDVFDGIADSYLDIVYGQKSAGSADVDTSTPVMDFDAGTFNSFEVGEAYWMWNADESTSYRPN